MVVCDVTIDSLDISDVVLNRGNCRSPVRKPEIRERDEAILNSVSEDERTKNEALMEIFGPMFLVIEQAAKDKTKLDEYKPNDRLGIAQVSKNMDPAKHYVFGDQVQILATNCNLLELSITANGRTETFSFEN